MSRSKPGQKNCGKSRKVSISSWKQPLSSMDSKRLHMEVCNSFRERSTKVMDNLSLNIKKQEDSLRRQTNSLQAIYKEVTSSISSPPQGEWLKAFILTSLQN